jgi:hypothetical protein
MRLDLSFAEINKVLAAKGLAWLEISADGEDIIVSAKGARLKLRQIETKLHHIVFSHKGANVLGKVASGAGAGMVSFFKIKLPRFLSLDNDHITICWGLLIPQMTIFKSYISVKGSGLQADLEI